MLHCVVIELRQHLCCANVFLKFESINNTNSLKFHVDENKILVQNEKSKAEVIVDNYFKILPETFSNLVVDAENASFRISLKDFLVTEEGTRNSDKNTIQINLTEENNKAALQCSNCEAILALEQNYDKIREFPTGTIDVSEFFCHHGPSYNDVLVPKEKDLFYGFAFIIINMSTLRNGVRSKENHLYCKRCLQYLGEELFNSRAAKLWGDSIRFKINEKTTDIFNSFNNSQIQQLILKAIEESSLPSPEPLLMNMHFTKVLLEAILPNRQQQFLLLHILEKHLPVLRNSKGDDGKFNNNSQEIKLYRNRAFKLFYRLISKDVHNVNESYRWPALLEYWRENINVLKMKISPLLFSALYKELNNNTSILPETYRNNNDDFSLSYIFY